MIHTSNIIILAKPNISIEMFFVFGQISESRSILKWKVALQLSFYFHSIYPSHNFTYMCHHAGVLIHFEVVKVRFHKRTITQQSFSQVIVFSQVIIRFDKLGSTYESNMENAVMMELPIIIGSKRQQHDA